MESRGLSNRNCSAALRTILIGFCLCLSMSTLSAQSKTTPEQQEKIIQSKEKVSLQSLKDKAASHKKVQPAPVRRPQMATAAKASTPSPTASDLERQITALKSKLEYAAENPQFFQEADLEKMRHALALREQQMLALAKDNK